MEPPPSSYASRLSALAVADVMHPGVLSTSKDATWRVLARMMGENSVHAIVLEDTDPNEVVTDLDVVWAALDRGALGLRERRRVTVPTVPATDSLDAAVKTLSAAHASHALVKAPDREEFAGMLSALDVAAVVAGRPLGPAPATPSPPTRPEASGLDRFHVSDAMHLHPTSVSPDTPVRDVAAILARDRIHAVVVAGIHGAQLGRNHGALAALTDLDVLHAVAAARLEAPARDVAATELLVVDMEERLDHAAALLVTHAVTHALVADPVARPVGVLSTLDVLRVLSAVAD